jgi:hypothetical protein
MAKPKKMRFRCIFDFYSLRDRCKSTRTKEYKSSGVTWWLCRKHAIQCGFITLNTKEKKEKVNVRRNRRGNLSNVHHDSFYDSTLNTWDMEND